MDFCAGRPGDHDSSQDTAVFYCRGRNPCTRHEPCPWRTFSLLEKIRHIALITVQTESLVCRTSSREKNWRRYKLANAVTRSGCRLGGQVQVCTRKKDLVWSRYRVLSRWFWGWELLPYSYSLFLFSLPHQGSILVTGVGTFPSRQA